MGVGSILSWVGGGFSRAAATGIVVGLFFLATGFLPWEAVVIWSAEIQEWITNGWTRLLLTIFGLVIIFVSLRWNVWSQRQKKIDELAEDISWAITELANWRSEPATLNITTFEQWDSHYRAWCQRVSTRLENRSFFTRADQLHFDRLGFIQPISMTEDARENWLLSQLRLKFDRLRDVINWSQERRR